jgi:hypothetical protein
MLAERLDAFYLNLDTTVTSVGYTKVNEPASTAVDDTDRDYLLTGHDSLCRAGGVPSGSFDQSFS